MAEPIRWASRRAGGCYLEWYRRLSKAAGQWPTRRSGAVHGAPGETWQDFDRALIRGLRGVPSGSSLAQLLAARRGVRHPVDLPTLSPKQVRDWVVAFHNWMGHWPKRSSGAIPTAPGESWATIDCAFVSARRGLEGYGSLAQFLQKECGVLNRQRPSGLAVDVILQWARAFHSRTGKWPNHTSGAIPEAPGETWGSVHKALCDGRRGLPRSSLYRLLWRVRPARRSAG
jgi:hypothetical protein